MPSGDFAHLSRFVAKNHAFGELTRHWHLTHCAQHEPVAVGALLWIKIIAFTLFRAYARLFGQRVRLRKVSLNEERKALYVSRLCGPPHLFFSG